ncbi:MAG: DmsE family decaheme c-type cytochrome [Thermoanaerobaculia bacterium]
MISKNGLAAMCFILAIAWPISAQVDNACAGCHDEAVAAMANSIHMRIKPFEVQGHSVGCEGCHGDGREHMDAGGDATKIKRFDAAPEWNATCLGCHTKKGQAQWNASTHNVEGLGCVDCHDIHKTDSNPQATCRNCHADTVAQFQLPSAHPVRDGKMSCNSCHNVHDSTEAMIRSKMRVNDLCFNCHQDKEGPFIFEHQPVQEDCRTCHVAHGSAVNNMLIANEPMLCLQCHDLHFHAGYNSAAEFDVGGVPRYSPFGNKSYNVAFSTKCTQCHSKVHGSDLPSQSVPGLGKSLTR